MTINFQDLFFNLLQSYPEVNLKNYIREYIVRHSRRFPLGGMLTSGDHLVLVGNRNVERLPGFLELVGDSGKILIFEPERRNYSRTLAAAKGNERIEVVRRGVWSEATEQVLKIASPDHPGDHKIPVEGIEHDNDYRADNYIEEQKIRVNTLPRLLEAHEFVPDVVEIKINGAELEVLRGADDLLENSGPRLLIKGHARFEESKEPVNEAISGYLEDFGYRTAITRPSRPTVGEISDWEVRSGDVFGWKKY